MNFVEGMRWSWLCDRHDPPPYTITWTLALSYHKIWLIVSCTSVSTYGCEWKSLSPCLQYRTEVQRMSRSFECDCLFNEFNRDAAKNVCHLPSKNHTCTRFCWWAKGRNSRSKKCTNVTEIFLTFTVTAYVLYWC